MTPALQYDASYGFTAMNSPARAYNETAFRYLLSVERRRFERSGDSFGLMLVRFKAANGVLAGSMPADIASRLFSGLSECLRETDFVGWYREGTVAGAVLTRFSESTPSGARDQLLSRVEQVLAAQLAGSAGALQVQMFELPDQAHQLGDDRSDLWP